MAATQMTDEEIMKQKGFIHREKILIEDEDADRNEWLEKHHPDLIDPFHKIPDSET